MWVDGEKDMTVEEETLELVVSQNRRALADWFAGYLGKPLPPECLESSSAWWKFLVQNLKPVHRDIANEARFDFNLKVDFDNPISVIGALKYWVEANRNAETRRDLQFQAARKQLISGVDIYSIAEQFHLSIDEVWRIVDRLEAEGHEICAE